ncbi:MAG: hypothetical protein WD046_13940 [Paracoccaceae bacterium]
MDQYDEVWFGLENLTATGAGLLVSLRPEIGGVATTGVVDWYVKSDGGAGDIGASADSFPLCGAAGIGVDTDDQLNVIIRMRKDALTDDWVALYTGGSDSAGSGILFVNGAARIRAAGALTGITIADAATPNISTANMRIIGVKHNEIAASDAASGVIEMTGLSLSSWHQASLILHGITVSDDGALLALEFQTASGWHTSGYLYSTASGNLSAGGAGMSYIRVGLLGNSTSEYAAGQVDIIDPGGAGDKAITANLCCQDTAGDTKLNASTGELTTADAITGIRIKASTGTVSAGRAVLVGGL